MKPAELTAAAIDAIEAAGGLMNQREIAAAWGVTESAIAQRIARGAFPDPVKQTGRDRLYLRSQVEHLAPASRLRPASDGQDSRSS